MKFEIDEAWIRSKIESLGDISDAITIGLPSVIFDDLEVKAKSLIAEQEKKKKSDLIPILIPVIRIFNPKALASMIVSADVPLSSSRFVGEAEFEKNDEAKIEKIDSVYNPMSINEDFFFAQTADGRGFTTKVSAWWIPCGLFPGPFVVPVPPENTLYRDSSPSTSTKVVASPR